MGTPSIPQPLLREQVQTHLHCPAVPGTRQGPPTLPCCLPAGRSPGGMRNPLATLSPAIKAAPPALARDATHLLQHHKLHPQAGARLHPAHQSLSPCRAWRSK
jgi:hypothetical protein